MRVLVIGAGAAGLVAAAAAAKQSAQVLLLEKNNKTGVKILMSGGTRCNLTHDTDAQGITLAFGHARRFLQPSVGGFPPSDVVQMFSRLGVATKTEATGKIFPVSNRAVEVRDALHAQAIDAGVEIRVGSAVDQLSHNGNCWNIATAGHSIEADRVIVTAGGKSWPGCGTTGDAYDWLRQLGHSIVTPRPALVPLLGGFGWTQAMSGITLADCQATVARVSGIGGRPQPTKKRTLLVRRAPWLFTHFGFSGPAAMDVSGVITAAPTFSDVALTIDLLPDLDRIALERAFADQRSSGGRQKVAALLGQWLPNRVADSIVQQTGTDVAVAELPRKRMLAMIDQVKRLYLPVTGTKGFAKAEVTAGGVSLDEVDPRTMASRKAAGLYIAGEVLDVDGWIGGYNFQAAFSTGRAAGIAAASSG